MKSWKHLLVSGAAGLILMTGAVMAEEAKEGVTLGTVVVTGTRTEERAERIPANVTIIDQEDIENSNAKNIPDLLGVQEGIVVRDLLGNGKSAVVDLRGFGETSAANTAVLVDGRRVNEIDLSGTDWTQIPLEQVERIEIVRGTGSVLYGDNATGGVINIITKTPSRKLGLEAEAIAASYGRNKERIAVSGGHGPVAASLFGSYDSTDGYRDNNHFRTRDVGGKIVFDPADFLSFSLSGSYHSDDFGLPGTLTEEALAIDRRGTDTPLDEGETKDGYLKFGFDFDFLKYGALSSDISYRSRENDSKFFSLFGTFLQNNEIDTWGITPRYVWNGKFLDRSNKLVAGVDIYLADQDVKSFFGTGSSPPLSGVATAGKDTYGFYFNNEFSLLQNLILTVGARHERVSYDLTQRDLLFGTSSIDDNVTRSENAFSGGLTYLYSGQSSVFFRANRSFRFPLTDELIESDQLTGNLRINADLKPQSGQHYELGVRHYFTRNIQARVTFFRAEIKDEIFYDPTPAPFFGSNINHPKTLHQGIEIGAKADLLRVLTLLGNYTYEKATFEKEPFKGNDIPSVPRHKANLGFRVHDLVRGLVFSADYNYVGESFLISDQANAFDKLDHYFTIDARVSYQWRWLKAFAGINNLTDEKYSEYAVIGGFPESRNFYPAPERNWVAGVTVAF